MINQPWAKKNWFNIEQNAIGDRSYLIDLNIIGLITYVPDANRTKSPYFVAMQGMENGISISAHQHTLLIQAMKDAKVM